MLDLDAGVHFDEVKQAVLIHEELDGAGVGIADILEGLDDAAAQLVAHARGQGHGRGLFHQLLVAALDAALALAKMQDVSVAVAQHLKFDVPWPFDKFFEVGRRGLRRHSAPRLRAVSQEGSSSSMARTTTHAAPADPAMAESEAQPYRPPLIIKASARWRGRGMRVGARHGGTAAFLGNCPQRGRQNAFGVPRRLLRKIYRTGHGTSNFRCWATATENVLHLGERECSIQRRHQKLVEESPSMALTRACATSWAAGVVKALKNIGYSQPAGTVEFLMERTACLLHRNERPHPGRASRHRTGHRRGPHQVAESALPRRKLADAVGPVEISRPQHRCRVTPRIPSPSCLPPDDHHVSDARWHGVRWIPPPTPDAVIPPYYDSLIAKLIVHGRDRSEASRACAAPSRCLSSRASKLRSHCTSASLTEPDFAAGRLNTHFLDRPAAGIRQVTGPADVHPLSATLCNTRCGLAQYVGPFPSPD